MPDSPKLLLLTGHSGPVSVATFSPDGTRLATGSYDETVVLWDPHTGEMLQRLEGLGDTPQHLAFLPDGEVVAASGGGGVRLWNSRTGQWVGTIPWLAGPLLFVDAHRFLAVQWPLLVVRVDAESGCISTLCVGPDEEGPSTRVCISGDGSTAAVLDSGDLDSLQFWDLHTGERIAAPENGWEGIKEEAENPEGSKCCENYALSRNGERVLLVIARVLRVHDTRTGKLIYRSPLPRNGPSPWGLPELWAAEFGPANDTVAVGYEDGELHFHCLDGRKITRIRASPGSIVSAVAFSRDGLLAATGSHDATVRIWDLDTWECRHELRGLGHHVAAVAWSPDGAELASGHGDGTLRVWDLGNGALRRTIRTGFEAVSRVVYLPAGDGIATLGWTAGVKSFQSGVQVWDRVDTVVRWEAAVDPSGAGELAVSHDGRFIAASSNGAREDVIMIWELSTGREVRRVPGRCPVFSPDSRILATTPGWRGGIRLWDAQTGSILRDLDDPPPRPTEDGEPDLGNQPDWITSLEFTRDANGLLGCYMSSLFGIWDLHSGGPLWTAYAEADFTHGTLSPDGKTAALAGSYLNNIQLWDLHDRSESTVLAGHTGSILDLAFAPDGSRLASASADGSIRIWDPASGRLLVTLLVLPAEGEEPSEEWIAHTPEGQVVASAGAQRFIRWQ